MFDIGNYKIKILVNFEKILRMLCFVMLSNYIRFSCL